VDFKSVRKTSIKSEYNLHFTNQYDWYGKVPEVKGNEIFCVTMTKSDSDWNDTTFSSHLEEVENGTQLDFAHKDWLKNNHHYRHSSFCWAMLLNGLKNYLEKGIVVPFLDRN